MSNGLRLVPVKAEMTAVNRQIRRYGQFLALARSQQSTIVTNAQSQAAFLAESGGTLSSLANLREQSEFASSSADFGLGLIHPHLMRIG
jgi:hypothetical protein